MLRLSIHDLIEILLRPDANALTVRFFSERMLVYGARFPAGSFACATFGH